MSRNKPLNHPTEAQQAKADALDQQAEWTPSTSIWARLDNLENLVLRLIPDKEPGAVGVGYSSGGGRPGGQSGHRTYVSPPPMSLNEVLFGLNTVFSRLNAGNARLDTFTLILTGSSELSPLQDTSQPVAELPSGFVNQSMAALADMNRVIDILFCNIERLAALADIDLPTLNSGNKVYAATSPTRG